MTTISATSTHAGWTQALGDRLWRLAGAVGIRTKILGIVLLPLIGLSLGILLQVRTALGRTMDAELRDTSVALARDLAARATDLILINDLYALHQLLKETRANNQDVRYVFVIGTDGQVLAHQFGEGFPAGLLEANAVAPDGHHNTRVLSTDEAPVWDTAVPIFGGKAGVARVGISQARPINTLNVLTGQILLTTLLVSALGVTAAAWLTWVLTRPIRTLSQAARAIGDGDLTQRVDRWADDEVGDLAEAFNGMARGLQLAERERRTNEAARERYVKGVITAQEDERKRIARELHDSTSQSLTSLVLGLRALGSCDNAQIQRHADDLREVAARTLDEVHELALQLRPSVLDDLGLAAAIERYIADCRRHSGLEIDLVMRGLDGPRLPAEVETALYRIVQESITNAIRHAEARTASVMIERHGGFEPGVRLVVEDDGKGFDPVTAGRAGERLGLYGMHERAQLLGGSVTLESQAGAGASVFVKIPLSDKEPAISA
jgi:signal transduction histidine kinase